MKNVLDQDSCISGKYKHFKGNFYDLYCVAFDNQDKKFILYQQCYGDQSFWVRPYEMFFESVPLESGGTIPRFSKTSARRQKAENKINKLIELIQSQSLIIHNSENGEEYIITSIKNTRNYVIVHPLKENYSSGYLTEYELMKRIGYTSCRINDETKYFKIKQGLRDCDRLFIGDNNIQTLSHQINPCSIDLQIANAGFLRTRRKLVDPQSIETVSTAEDLWRPVHIHKSKKHPSGYIKLHPGKTILTRTKEKIRIPNDCAAKIEIKSTFARLSLDITSGDFCNPGYFGHYPLEITNKGKHTIIIHENETMAQLMLIPLHGPILENYSDKATYINKDGYDDGTPYTFWRERSIKSLRKEAGTQQIVELYQKTLNIINTENTPDINGFRDRFNNGFLAFCQKNYDKEKYLDQNTSLPDGKKLLKAYCKREKIIKSLFSFKWGSGILAIISAIYPILQMVFTKAPQAGNVSSAVESQPIQLWPFILVTIFFLGLTAFLIARSPKVFCTFENIDIDQL